MGIGVSVFLLALGAVLTFAVNASVGGIDINVVGVILMVAGLIGLALTMLVFGRRDAVVATRTGPAVAPTVATQERVVTRERDVY